jgi:vacuolar-type H+-ATPase subunit E/Vma4
VQTLGSAESVIASIREDADAEVQRIEETTAAELATIRSEAASTSVDIADREERLAAERRASEDRVARQEWEGRRAAIEQREAWIARAVAEARQRWSGGDVNALIREALAHMPGRDCEIAVHPRDRDGVNVPGVRITTADIAGGCIASAENVSFDNSYEARARRLEPDWRNALSRMYSL